MLKKHRDGFTIYHDGSTTGDGWRWRLCRKGRIRADSSEAYASKSNCSRALRSVAAWLYKGTLRVYVLDPKVEPGRKR